MISVEMFHVARRLAYYLKDAPSSKREAALRLVAAWPGADRLAAKYNPEARFDWWELDLLTYLATYARSSYCIAAIVDLLMDGVYEEVARALEALPEEVQNGGSAIIWWRAGQVDGVAGLWEPDSPVFRCEEGEWRVLEAYAPPSRSAYAAAFRLLHNQGLSESEISLTLRKALYFRREQTVPRTEQTICQDRQ